MPASHRSPVQIHSTYNGPKHMPVDRAAGTLFVVATPIGNLDDLSPRAQRVLGSADLIACEDTRTSRTLLTRFRITAQTVALHRHNESAASADILASLLTGQDVALISDAGTPTVSDPGATLVAAAHRAGIAVLPLPGPSAAIAAISVSGFTEPRWLFAGFMPAQRKARKTALQGLVPGFPTVLYEAPHRIRALLHDLHTQFGDAHEVVICRELTKKFEETARLPLAEAVTWIDADPHRQQGEFVVVLQAIDAPAQDDGEPERVLRVLMESLPASEAVRLTARLTGAARNVLYARAQQIALEAPEDETASGIQNAP